MWHLGGDLGPFRRGGDPGRIPDMRSKIPAAKRGLLAALALGLLVALGASSAAGAAPKTPAYGKKLQTLIPEAMKANAIPGVVVQIESPSKGNWSATFGTAELGKTVPMSLRDHFRIGSNTKTMTSTVILQLVGEGDLKLNDPIGKFVKGVPNGNRITIRELSEMRSGLYSYTFDPGFNATLDNNPKKGWTPQELLKIGLAHKPNFAPGKDYEY